MPTIRPRCDGLAPRLSAALVQQTDVPLLRAGLAENDPVVRHSADLRTHRNRRSRSHCRRLGGSGSPRPPCRPHRPGSDGQRQADRRPGGRGTLLVRSGPEGNRRLDREPASRVGRCPGRHLPQGAGQGPATEGAGGAGHATGRVRPHPGHPATAGRAAERGAGPSAQGDPRAARHRPLRVEGSSPRPGSPAWRRC